MVKNFNGQSKSPAFKESIIDWFYFLLVGNKIAFIFVILQVSIMIR